MHPRNQFKADFPEREGEEQKEMSREDNCFMEIVKESTKLVSGQALQPMSAPEEPNNQHTKKP